MNKIIKIEFNLLEDSFTIFFKVPTGFHMIEIQYGTNKSLEEIIEHCFTND